MEQRAVSVAWFRAVWQKVTSSCSVRGGWDDEGGEGWEGGREGMDRGTEQRESKEKPRVHCVLVIKDKLKLLQMQTRYGGWQTDGTDQRAGLQPFVFLLQVVTSTL
ncbi:uncharacterized [Tachysurus ichikawai]